MNLGPGMSLGYLNYVDQKKKDETQALINSIRQNELTSAARTQAARPVAGNIMQSLLGGQQDDSQLPPAPGQPSVAMQQPGAQAAPQGSPAQGAAAQAAPSPNYRSYDDHVQANQQPQPDAQLPAAPAASAPPAAPKPKFDLGSVLKALKRNNVSDDMTLDVLDNLMPYMNAENKAELDTLKTQLGISREEHATALRQWDLSIKANDEKRKVAKDAGDAAAKSENAQIRKKHYEDMAQNWTAANKSRDARDQLLLKRESRLTQAAGQGEDGKTLTTFGAQIKDRISELNNLVANRPDDPRIDAIEKELDYLTQQRDVLADRIRAKHADMDAVGKTPDATDRPASGSSKSSGPQPTAADRAWAKKHPEDAAKFKAHFGVEP